MPKKQPGFWDIQKEPKNPIRTMADTLMKQFSKPHRLSDRERENRFRGKGFSMRGE